MVKVQEIDRIDQDLMVILRKYALRSPTEGYRDNQAADVRLTHLLNKSEIHQSRSKRIQIMFHVIMYFNVKK